MIIMIIVASLIYFLAGLLFASNAIISTRRFSTEEEQKDSEAITDKNFKTIGILMIIGAILGIPGAMSLDLSLKIGVGILVGAFIVGMFIRIIIQKNQP